MKKRILFFCSLLLISLASTAQVIERLQPLGSRLTGLQVLGKFKVDSVFQLPVNFPLSTTKGPGALAYQESDSSLYVWTGYQWLRQNGSGGGGGAANLSPSLTATNMTINNSNGSGVVIPAADGTNAGLVSATKYNEWTNKLSQVNVTGTPSPNVYSVTSSAGSGFTIPAADGVNAGLLSAAKYAELSAKISNVAVTGSLTGNGNGTPLKLSGDNNAPGADMLYGTNSAGIKGWYSQPGGGGGGSADWIKLTYAELDASTGLNTNRVYYITDAGREGPFVYVGTVANQTSDNGGTIIVNAGLQQFRRIYSGPILVTWFGAVADAVVPGSGNTVTGTDNKTAFDKAIAAAASSEQVYIPAGKYRTTALDTIAGPKLLNLYCDGDIYTNGNNFLVFKNGGGAYDPHTVAGNGNAYGSVNIPSQNKAAHDAGTGPNWSGMTGTFITVYNTYEINVTWNKVSGFKNAVEIKGQSGGSQENRFTIRWMAQNANGIALTSVDGNSYCDKNIFDVQRISGGLAIKFDGYAPLSLAPDPVTGVKENYNGAFRSNRFRVMIENVDSVMDAFGDITDNVFDFTAVEGGALTGVLGTHYFRSLKTGPNVLRSPRWVGGGVFGSTYLYEGMGFNGIINVPIYQEGNLVAPWAKTDKDGYIILDVDDRITAFRRSQFPDSVFRFKNSISYEKDTVLTGTSYTFSYPYSNIYATQSGTTVTLPLATDFPDKAIKVFSRGNITTMVSGNMETNAVTSVGPYKMMVYRSKFNKWYSEDPTTATSGGGGNPTAGAFSSTPDDKGLTTSGSDVILHAADSTHPGAVTTGDQKWAGTKQINVVKTPQLSMWTSDFGSFDLRRTKNGISFNDVNGTPNPNSTTLTAYNFSSGSSTKDAYLVVGKQATNSVGIGNDGTDMILGTEKTTGGFEFRKLIGYSTASLQNGTPLAKIFGSSGNMQIGGGTMSDDGFKLSVRGTLRATGNVLFDGLIGANTRMVVAQPDGSLTTQDIPTGGGSGGSSIFTAGAGTGSPYYRTAGPVNIGINPSQSYAWTHWGASTTTRAIMEFSTSSAYVTVPRNGSLDYNGVNLRFTSSSVPQIVLTDYNSANLANKNWVGPNKIGHGYIDPNGAAPGSVYRVDGAGTGTEAVLPNYEMPVSTNAQVVITSTTSGGTEMTSTSETIPTSESAAIPAGSYYKFSASGTISTTSTVSPTFYASVGGVQAAITFVSIPSGLSGEEFTLEFVAKRLASGYSWNARLIIDNGTLSISKVRNGYSATSWTTALATSLAKWEWPSSGQNITITNSQWELFRHQ
jgi:hypothetical protein